MYDKSAERGKPFKFEILFILVVVMCVKVDKNIVYLKLYVEYRSLKCRS